MWQVLANVNEFFTRPGFYLRWGLKDDKARPGVLASLVVLGFFAAIFLIMIAFTEWIGVAAFVVFMLCTVALLAWFTIEEYQVKYPEETEQ